MSVKQDSTTTDQSPASDRSLGSSFVRRLLAGRFVRTTASLAIVLTAFVAYSTIVVPLIEPSIDRPTDARTASDEDLESARGAVRRQREQLRAWFDDDDWELTSPRVIETSRGILLVKKLKTLPDGSVEMSPCTMVLLEGGTSQSDAERNRRAVIVRAPEGAILQFDEPFDLKKLEVGNLTSGKLVGPITIYSDRQSPGPEDDLFIETRDVTLASHRVTAPGEVKLSFGTSRGSGHDLRIDLIPDKGSSSAEESGLSIAGVKSFELRRNVHMHFDMSDPVLRSNLPQRGEVKDDSPEQTATKPQSPVEVRSRGPFRFDFSTHQATFRDHVDVVQFNPNGPGDQLNCQLLKIVFVSLDETGQPKTEPADGKPDLTNLEIRRIEADGSPVVLRSPRLDIEAQGERLVYDLQTSTASLISRGQRQATLSRQSDQIVARELHIQRSETGDISQIAALGPGWLKGSAPDDPTREFHIRWSEELRMAPRDGLDVVSIRGAAYVESTGMGVIEAAQLYAWLRRSPPDPSPDQPSGQLSGIRIGDSQLVPERLAAIDQVRIDSPQLIGALGKLEVWFRHEQPLPPVAAASHQPGSGAVVGPIEPGRTAVRQVGFQDQGPALFDPAKPADSDRANRLRIDATSMQVEVTVRAGEMTVSQLTAQGHVRLREIETQNPGEQPLRVEGDLVHVGPENATETDIVVRGKPGLVAGRGMSMSGGEIQMHRGRNQVWIDGPGRLELPVNRDLAGQERTTANPLVVTWRGRMDFDGKQAQFDEDVQARLDRRTLSTARMEVSLVERFNFADRDSQQQPDVELLVCRNGVRMEGESFEQGRRASAEQLQAANLSLHQPSGHIEATGPGSIRTVRLGSSTAFGPPGDQPAQPLAAPGAESLSFLDLKFEDQAVGNLHRREITFFGNVETLYGPVENWQQTVAADRLGPSDIYLTCAQVSIIETPDRMQQARAFELNAEGNTIVEGQEFHARGDR